jgi:hypothetical protein
VYPHTDGHSHRPKTNAYEDEQCNQYEQVFRCPGNAKKCENIRHSKLPREVSITPTTPSASPFRPRRLDITYDTQDEIEHERNYNEQNASRAGIFQQLHECQITQHGSLPLVTDADAPTD